MKRSGDELCVYDAYGNVTSEIGTVESQFLYTGRLFDEATGLQNNLYRWYDPAAGELKRGELKRN